MKVYQSIWKIVQIDKKEPWKSWGYFFSSKIFSNNFRKDWNQFKKKDWQKIVKHSKLENIFENCKQNVAFLRFLNKKCRSFLGYPKLCEKNLRNLKSLIGNNSSHLKRYLGILEVGKK